MSKFVYGKNELHIGKHQCDLCIYKVNDEYLCQKFEKAPAEVLENKIKCKEFQGKGQIIPWEK